MAVAEKPRLRGMTLAEMEALLADAGFEKFRAKQLYHWVQRKMVRRVDEMKNLPLELRKWLTDNTEFGGVAGISMMKKSADGSYKFLFELGDGRQVETVLMPDPKRAYWTQCLSSQVGCAVDCKFCVTGYNGFFRNMSVDEIVDQVLYARRYLLEHEPESNYRNLVYMGMGEPLLNTDAIVKSIQIVSSTEGLDLSPKRITVSTSGILPGMRRLSEAKTGACIAVSLNAPSQKLREEIMPITKKYPIDELIDVCKRYPYAKNKRVTYEYVLLAGVNDSIDHAKELRRLLSDHPCKVNLIPFNPSPVLPYERPTDESVEDFLKILMDSPIAVCVRWSKALDVDGACGQLAGKQSRKKQPVAPDGMPTDLDFFATVPVETGEEE